MSYPEYDERTLIGVPVEELHWNKKTYLKVKELTMNEEWEGCDEEELPDSYDFRYTDEFLDCLNWPFSYLEDDEYSYVVGIDIDEIYEDEDGKFPHKKKEMTEYIGKYLSQFFNESGEEIAKKIRRLDLCRTFT